MKRERVTTNYKRTVFSWACSLGLLLGASGPALAASTCTDCHGMPPIDAAYRNITTGGFKGSHRSHQPAVASAANCADCHTGSGAYLTDHMNGRIDLSSNINSSPVAATYSKGVFFNQTSNPVMGTCANVNCHFGAVTPVWSSAPLSSPAGCSICHSNPPSDGSHPGLSGSGKKHGDYYGTGTTSCIKCHVDHTPEAKPFAHATSAGNRSLILAFTAAPNSSGTYSKTANLAYPAYLQTTAANRNGTCSAMYCHSDGAGGAPKSAAVWGGTLPADCSGCHGGNATAAVVIATGLHAQHINNAAVLGTNFECARCHNGPVAAGNDRAISGLSSHVDGSKTVAFAGGGTYTTATKTCSATTCHNAGKATAPQPPAPVWTGAAMGCNGCHGRATATGAPDYANGGAAAALANSHAKHAVSAADCDACHTNTTTTGTSVKTGSSLHNNGTIEVSFNTTKAGATAAWNAGTKTCANTYCHGTTLTGGTAKSPVWGATLSGCGTCHGFPPATTSGVHTGVTATQCITCHPHVNATGTGFTDATKHVNGTVDASGGHAVPFFAHSAPPFTSCAGCHNTSAAGPYPAATAGSAPNCRGCHTLADPTVTATGCTSCHASPPNGTTHPNIVGSHVKHASLAGAPASCAICHSGAGAGSGVSHGPGNKGTNPAIDNIVFTAAQAGASATWAATTKTCSNTYCHGATLAGGGTNKNPVWGTTLTGCGTCHGAPPATATHTGVTVTQCVNCHPHVNAAGTGFTDATKHINGVIDAAGGDCTTCHNAQQGTGTRRVVGTDTVLASRHIAAATINAASCQVCHEQGTFGHMAAGDVAVGMYNQDTGASLAYDGTAATAANLEASCNSCHDANGASRLGANALKPFADSGDNTAPPNIGWTAGAMAHSAQMSCFNCHGNSAGTAGNTLTPKYNAHGSASPKMLQFAYNANDTMTTSANFCYNCHGTTTANGVTSPSIQAAVNLASGIGHKTAKCSDCHDQHTAKPGPHTAGPNAAMAPVLNGTPGKGGWPATNPAMATTWNGTGTLAVTYTAKPAATNEYEICFKCHAGSVPAPAGYTAGALRMTDLALEFNPNNKSGHPVVASLNNYAGSATPKPLLATDMVAPWTAIGTQTMTCSDCHGATGTSAKGPHGSSVRWMLTGANQAWPFTTTAGNGTSSGTPWSISNYNTGTAPNKLFCLNCHVVNATNGMHDALISGGKHSSFGSSNRGTCLSCHIRVPHGGKTARLLRLGTAAVLGRYAPDGNGAEVGTSTTQTLSKYSKGTQTSNRRGSFSGVGCNEHTGGTDTW